MTSVKRYSELSSLPTFEERFEYLRFRGNVGESTFGFDRWMNQYFYHSAIWRSSRDFVIARDNGCDLGIPGLEIHSRLVVHHMNIVTQEDFENGSDWITDPEFLITTSHQTHNAIHYGDVKQILGGPVVRKPGDTALW